MINYTSDIAEPMFPMIADDPAYQVPGLFDLQPIWADPTPATKRMLVLIEIFSSYLGQINDDAEAKTFQEILDRIELCNKVGSRVHSNNGDRAQLRCLRWIAMHGAFARPYG